MSEFLLDIDVGVELWGERVCICSAQGDETRIFLECLYYIYILEYGEHQGCVLMKKGVIWLKP